jgi:hypothetical protein
MAWRLYLSWLQGSGSNRQSHMRIQRVRSFDRFSVRSIHQECHSDGTEHGALDSPIFTSRETQIQSFPPLLWVAVPTPYPHVTRGRRWFWWTMQPSMLLAEPYQIVWRLFVTMQYRPEIKPGQTDGSLSKMCMALGGIHPAIAQSTTRGI